MTGYLLLYIIFWINNVIFVLFFVLIIYLSLFLERLIPCKEGNYFLNKESFF